MLPVSESSVPAAFIVLTVTPVGCNSFELGFCKDTVEFGYGPLVTFICPFILFINNGFPAPKPTAV